MGVIYCCIWWINCFFCFFIIWNINNLKRNKIKQETLEEAFEKNAQYLDSFENKNTYEYGFKDGAKWQQEQDKKLFDECNQYTMDCIEVELTRPLPFNKWFEQFRYR